MGVKYKCCSGTCPTIDLETCWNNNQKGLKYGVKEVDCCGCEVVKCLDCEPPSTSDVVCSKAKPMKCYTYNSQAAHAPVTGCWESSCPENPSDAPADDVCDTACEIEQVQTTDCSFNYKTCRPNRMINACPLRTPGANAPRLGLQCYNDPIMIPDPSGGKYYDGGSDTCKQCNKWRYDKKSCDAQNEAVATATCHQVGENEFDKKCMKKTVTQDSCECDVHTCTVAHNEAESKFGADEVCPKDHVKLTGVSICGVARDLCFQCPALIPTDDVPCPVGKVIESADTNGCPKNVCQLPTISGECATNNFRLDTDTNPFICIPA